MRKRLVVVLVVLGLLAGACGGDDDDDDAGATTTAAADEGADAGIDPDGVVRIGHDLESASTGGFKWDPSAATSVQNSQIGFYLWVYGSLLRLQADGTLVPELAESVEIVNPTTITVVMREGLTTSDGTTLDAAAMKSILEANLAKKNPSGGNIPAFRPGFYSLQTVTLTDDSTLTLSIPDGTAAVWHDTYFIGQETLPVLPGTNFDRPTGAGPFMINEYLPGQALTLDKNPDYWDADNIDIAGIEVVHIPPENVQAPTGALNAGQVDWTRIDYAQIDAVQSVEVIVEPDQDAYTRVIICKSEAPFDDVTVRQALNYATNKEAINDALYNGEATVAWDFWPEGNTLHNDDNTEKYAYDPEEAQSLLQEAGVESLTVGIIPISVQGLDTIAQIIQQQWAQVGITVNIVPTTNVVQDLLTDVKEPLGILPRGGVSRTRLDGVSGTTITNICDYADPELDAMITELRQYSDTSEEGIQLWHEISAKVVDDALDIPLLFGVQVYGIDTDKLGGYELPKIPAFPVPDMWELYVKSE